MMSKGKFQLNYVKSHQNANLNKNSISKKLTTKINRPMIPKFLMKSIHGRTMKELFLV